MCISSQVFYGILILMAMQIVQSISLPFILQYFILISSFVTFTLFPYYQILCSNILHGCLISNRLHIKKKYIDLIQLLECLPYFALLVMLLLKSCFHIALVCVVLQVGAKFLSDQMVDEGSGKMCMAVIKFQSWARRNFTAL